MLSAITENRNVPLTWTNQISAQKSASKTLAIIRPPAPVSEMERSRVALITLMCVLISNISGLIVEMRIKPGDTATIYCDCTYQSKFIIAWIIKPSNEHQPPLIRLTEDTTPPRYSRVWNYTKGTYDLLVKNITESDLGLYYCALTVKGNTSGGRLPDVYHKGNRTTFLSFLDSTVPCTDPSETPSTLQTTSTTPLVSDCSVCWKLLVSACPACVLLTSVISSISVYCICSRKTKADGAAERRGNMEMRNHNECTSMLREDQGVSKGHSTMGNWLTLSGVLISSISGIVVEMRVKSGDNVTIHYDCTYLSTFTLIWFIKPAKEHQPPLINLTEDTTPPRVSRVWNYSKATYDLQVKNISESDLGLYYCALHEVKLTRKEYGERVREDVYHEGNRTTFLSFLGESVHPDLLVLLIWVSFKS
ncbi:hypothetical protein NFI96_023163 [Prochilodus magdalenae]|nr:hypothetical protein NFI96_023163 [Prochilodus magdalenae]